jgi:hypothetical protein
VCRPIPPHRPRTPACRSERSNLKTGRAGDIEGQDCAPSLVATDVHGDNPTGIRLGKPLTGSFQIRGTIIWTARRVTRPRCGTPGYVTQGGRSRAWRATYAPRGRLQENGEGLCQKLSSR